MFKTERKKNSKILSIDDLIKLLNLLKTSTPEKIAEHFNITPRAVQYTRKKYNAYSDKEIDDAVRMINVRRGQNCDYPPRDYDLQESCEHHDCTVFLKCKCTLTLGENELDRVIEILLAKREYLRAHPPVVIRL